MATNTTTKENTSNVKKITDPEIKELKKDYEQMKKLVAKLQEDLKAAGSKKISKVQENGLERLEKIEERVKENPRAALGYAFGAGFLASILLRR